MAMRSLMRTLIATTAVSSVSAWALFDAELLNGRRWYDVKASGGTARGVSATETSIAAHLDPIPLVPIAFGASASMLTLNHKDLGANYKEAKVIEPALEVKAWLPLVPIVTPYVKVKVPVMATYAAKSTINTGISGVGVEQTELYKLSGYHLNAGVKYSPLPLIKVLFEAGLGMQKATPEEIKVAGSKVDTGSPKLDMNSKYAAIGVEVGL